MAADGAQRKTQRRILVLLNVILAILGLLILRFDIELMHDTLIAVDNRFGWILWLSFFAATVTIALSVIGCYGVTRSNNWLFFYSILCLIVLAILSRAFQVGATETAAAEEWLVSNWPGLKAQLGNQIPDSAEDAAGEIRSASEYINSISIAMWVLLVFAKADSFWILGMHKYVDKSLCTFSWGFIGGGPVIFLGTIVLSIISDKAGWDAVAACILSLGLPPLGWLMWLVSGKESVFLCKLLAAASFLLGLLWVILATVLFNSAADSPDTTVSVAQQAVTSGSGSWSLQAAGEELGLNDDLWNPWSDWLWGEKEWYLLLGYICVLISVGGCWIVGTFGGGYMMSCGGGTWDSSITAVVVRDMGRCSEPETKEVRCCQ